MRYKFLNTTDQLFNVFVTKKNTDLIFDINSVMSVNYFIGLHFEFNNHVNITYEDGSEVREVYPECTVTIRFTHSRYSDKTAIYFKQVVLDLTDLNFIYDYSHTFLNELDSLKDYCHYFVLKKLDNIKYNVSQLRSKFLSYYKEMKEKLLVPSLVEYNYKGLCA